MSNRKTTSSHPSNDPSNPLPSLNRDGVTKIWRSLGELEETPRYQTSLEQEFLEGAGQMESDDEREMSRRSFLKVMGASSALMGVGLVACRRPESFIVPYAESPEWSIPGKPVYYASSMPRATGAVPLVVTTYENRPTKLEPNKRFDSLGGTDAFTQASVLDMYDPARSRDFLQKGKPTERTDFEDFLKTIEPDATLAFVFGEDASPTRSRLVKELKKKYSKAEFFTYEPLTGEEQRDVYADAFGNGVNVLPDFNEANVILSLDSDFLELDLQGAVSGFYKNRFVEGADYTQKPDSSKLNRLYVVEGGYSLTGGMADHRLRIAPSQVVAIATEIAKQLGIHVDITGGNLDDYQKKWAVACAEDLKSQSGKSVVLAGSRQSKELHQLCVAINHALGNYGKTIMPVTTERAFYKGVRDLIDGLEKKAFDTVILLTPANPNYDADGFADVIKKSNATVIQWGMRRHNTANAADWHVPAAHYLESWSDARTIEGVYTVVQPLILPLYGGVSEIELLDGFLTGTLFDCDADAKVASPAYHHVRKTFASIAGDEGEKSWMTFLRDGFWKKSRYERAKTTPKILPITVRVPDAPTARQLELVFSTDGSIFDGRYINNAWLQEAPDPISKITWDNVALVSPQTAKELGLYDKILRLQPDGEIYFGMKVKENAGVGPDGEGKNHSNPLVTLSVNGRKLEVPLMIAFGQADNVLSLSLGYGQGFDQYDELGRGPLNEADVSLVSVNAGFNAYSLRTDKTPYLVSGVQLTDSHRRYHTAVTQEHHAMYGRALAREISTMPTTGEHGDVKDFDEQLRGVSKQGMDAHLPDPLSIYRPKGSKTWHEAYKADKLLYDERQQWAMTIDLSNCIGCNACLIACQAENNIPVVGKEQVARGREMHWIRMDRYFAAVERKDKRGKKWMDESNPEMIPQPVACQQCESAPCESVCPVNATVHTEDGLNAMAYNRCLGTRYCANNCPYKTRRFNFFDYSKRNPLIHKNLYKGPLGTKQQGEAPHLQKNPNVTVRMRGVMEKCTYCVQRIQSAKGKVKANLKKKVELAGVPSEQVTLTPEELRPKVDSVRVACQDACPANAITFGNMLDKEKATVMRSRHSSRNYELLHYIGTRPRTTYLARVKNPNPAMPDAHGIGRATITMH